MEIISKTTIRLTAKTIFSHFVFKKIYWNLGFTCSNDMHSWKDLWNIWTNIYSVRHLIKHIAEFCTLFRTSSLLIDFLTITLASWIKGLSLEEWFSDGQHFFLSAGPTVVMVVCFGEFFKSFLWLLLQCWVTFDIHS